MEKDHLIFHPECARKWVEYCNAIRSRGLKLQVIDGMVFYPISENYLLYLCERDEVHTLTESRVVELMTEVVKALEKVFH